MIAICVAATPVPERCSPERCFTRSSTCDAGKDRCQSPVSRQGSCPMPFLGSTSGAATAFDEKAMQDLHCLSMERIA